jgi:hypothetical protein
VVKQRNELTAIITMAADGAEIINSGSVGQKFFEFLRQISRVTLNLPSFLPTLESERDCNQL